MSFYVPTDSCHDGKSMRGRGSCWCFDTDDFHAGFFIALLDVAAAIVGLPMRLRSTDQIKILNRWKWMRLQNPNSVPPVGVSPSIIVASLVSMLAPPDLAWSILPSEVCRNPRKLRSRAFSGTVPQKHNSISRKYLTFQYIYAIELLFMKKWSFFNTRNIFGKYRKQHLILYPRMI